MPKLRHNGSDLCLFGLLSHSRKIYVSLYADESLIYVINLIISYREVSDSLLAAASL